MVHGGDAMIHYHDDLIIEYDIFYEDSSPYGGTVSYLSDEIHRRVEVVSVDADGLVYFDPEEWNNYAESVGIESWDLLEQILQQGR